MNGFVSNIIELRIEGVDGRSETSVSSMSLFQTNRNKTKKTQPSA